MTETSAQPTSGWRVNKLVYFPRADALGSSSQCGNKDWLSLRISYRTREDHRLEALSFRCPMGRHVLRQRTM